MTDRSHRQHPFLRPQFSVTSSFTHPIAQPSAFRSFRLPSATARSPNLYPGLIAQRCLSTSAIRPTHGLARYTQECNTNLPAATWEDFYETHLEPALEKATVSVLDEAAEKKSFAVFKDPIKLLAKWLLPFLAAFLPQIFRRSER